MKCDKCNQEIQPTYVGPGDHVKCDGIIRLMVTVVGQHPYLSDEIVVKVESEGFTSVPASLLRLDGRPVAGFRDPAQEDLRTARERVAELESQVSEYVAENVSLQDKVKLVGNQHAGLRGLYDRRCEEVRSLTKINALLERQLKAAEITDEDFVWATDRYICNFRHTKEDAARELRTRINERKEAVK